MKRNSTWTLVVCLTMLCAISATTAEAAVVNSNIPYNSPGSTSALLDVYRPSAGLVPGTPTVLYIHGGGWQGGDKTNHTATLTTIADAGFGVVSCNYTLSTPTTPSYPQAVHDVKAVVRWIRTTGNRAFGLSRTIIAFGSSAGAHLAMIAGYTADLAIFEPLPHPPGSYHVDAVVEFFGAGDFVYHVETYGDAGQLAQFLGAAYSPATQPLYAEASPLTHVTNDDPPTAIYQGLEDATVPFEHAILIHDALDAATVYNEMFLCPGVGHGFPGFGGDEAVGDLVVGIVPTLLANEERGDMNCDEALDLGDVAPFVVALLDSAAFDAASTCSLRRADFNLDGEINGLDIAGFVEKLLGP